MDTLNIILEICQILNPATLLPAVESGHLLHQCIKTLEQTYSSRSDLLDEPLDSPEADSLLMGSKQNKTLQPRSWAESGQKSHILDVGTSEP